MTPPQSRSSVALTNIAYSVGTQLALLILTFFSRTIFIHELGVELLGLSALFLSLMVILTTLDLGITGAVMYSLYEPLAKNDELRLAQIMHFSRNIHRWAAGLVLVVGLGLAPTLPSLTDAEVSNSRLFLYYGIILAGTVAHYLLASRVVLLNAMQRIALIKVVGLVAQALRNVTQIAVLLTTQSFALFLIVYSLSGIINNVALHVWAGRTIPFCRDLQAPSHAERRSLFGPLRDMSLYRIAGGILNNSDPILISLIAGTATLGLYSNYAYLVGAVIVFTDLIFAAVSPAIGNAYSGMDRTRARQLFDELNLTAILLFGSVASVFAVALEPAIVLWLGQAFTLGHAVAALAALNFYLIGVSQPVWSFRGATGSFQQTRFILFATAALNIALSLILGSLVGVAGVLAATAVARVTTTMWLEPLVLCRYYLAGSTTRYFAEHLRSLLVVTVTCAVGISVVGLLPDDRPWARLALGLILPPLVAILGFWISHRRSRAWRDLRNRVIALRQPTRTG